MDSVCLTCGKAFEAIPQSVGKFCSRKCYWDSMVTSIEYQCEICGVSFRAFKSRKNVHYCSLRCMGKDRSMEKHHAWKGGFYPEEKRARLTTDYKEWRSAVFSRDDWTCQDCGVRGVILRAHHVFTFAEFPEHRLSVWNGITLCVDCHRKLHSKNKEVVKSG